MNQTWIVVGTEPDGTTAVWGPFPEQNMAMTYMEEYPDADGFEEMEVWLVNRPTSERYAVVLEYNDAGYRSTFVVKGPYDDAATAERVARDANPSGLVSWHIAHHDG